MIFIFSKADKKDEIETILAKPEFQEYKERLQYLDKAVENVDQTKALLQRADAMYANNFSFKFASVLRRRSVQCADQILSDMGRASLNDVKNLLVVGDGGKKDFIDFLAERFRTSIAGPNVYGLVDEIPQPAANAPPPDASIARESMVLPTLFPSGDGRRSGKARRHRAVGRQCFCWCCPPTATLASVEEESRNSKCRLAA